jgi:hypothetical protein
MRTPENMAARRSSTRDALATASRRAIVSSVTRCLVVQKGPALGGQPFARRVTANRSAGGVPEVAW